MNSKNEKKEEIFVNDIKRGPLANGLALYDFQRNPVDIKGLFYFAERWFEAGKLIPTRTGGKGSKTITFQNGKRRLEKENFERMDGFWIGSTPPNHDSDWFDSIFSVEIQIFPRKTAFVLCWDDSIIGFEQAYLEKLVKNVDGFLKPAYGYAYQRFFNRGASLYPFGCLGGNGGRSLEEEDEINEWSNKYFCSDKYRTGMLRDIYRFNVLSPAHFEIHIRGKLLKTWIDSSPHHGTLKQLTDTLWSWWILPQHVNNVRAALKETGMLICVS